MDFLQRKIEVSFRGEQEKVRNEHSVYARWREIFEGTCGLGPMRELLLLILGPVANELVMDVTAFCESLNSEICRSRNAGRAGSAGL
jgi:hypothetical protein